MRERLLHERVGIVSQPFDSTPHSHFGSPRSQFGNIIPIMGSPLVDALFPQTKQRVLSILFGQPDRWFTLMDVIGLANSGVGAVHRELERLEKAGLVQVTSILRQRRYAANQDSPIYEELRSIIEKTAGVADVVRTALAPMNHSIQLAILYGSVAKGTDRATSDIDVLLVTDNLTLESVFSALEPAEKRLGRRVSPTVYTRDEFLRRQKARNPFLTKVLAGPHVILLGSVDALASR